MKTNLNQQQQKAVEYTEGPLIILAGAGAGKTKTIIERIVHIVKSGVEPYHILAVTFTNKAAGEMRERTLSRMREEGLLESWTNGIFRPQAVPMIKTFHSLGMYILQEEYMAAGVTKRLTIYDESDSVGVIKEICERLDIDPKMHEPRKIKGAISRMKGDMASMSEYTQNAFSPFQKVVARVWQEYENKLKEKKAVDFDDLIAKTVRLLEEHQEIKEKYNQRWKYIHIDEYQDTNNSQYLLSKLLTGRNNNICVVGDIDQNIYSWRGANLKNLLKFEEDFEDTEMIKLEQNYRSTQTILTAANEIIKINKIRKEKNLFTENGEGDLITVAEHFTDKEEAQYVASEIAKLKIEGIKGEDIVILYRNNFQSRVLEQAFISCGLDYHLLGIRFFDRKEVKDIMSYLKLAFNKSSTEDMKRALTNPTRGFGKVAMTKILGANISELNNIQRDKLDKFWQLISEIEILSATSYPSELILKIVKDSGIEKAYREEETEEAQERLANIYELLALASEYDKYEQPEAMDRFLEESALVSDQDTDTKEEDKVRLMTIHASKGLEFKYVFIVGMEDTLFPSDKKAFQNLSKEEQEEERRLFYVALTRAREKLYLTHALERMLYGKRQWNERSEFIDDIPEELLLELKAKRYNQNKFNNDGESDSDFEKIVVYL